MKRLWMPLYIADYLKLRRTHGEYPRPGDRSGRWFKVSGENAKAS